MFGIIVRGNTETYGSMENPDYMTKGCGGGGRGVEGEEKGRFGKVREQSRGMVRAGKGEGDGEGEGGGGWGLCLSSKETSDQLASW